jgi:hypothetical protein
MNQVQHYESIITMFRCGEQAITHIRGCHGDSNQKSNLQGYKFDNATHAGQEGTMSGYSSQHDQRVGLSPTSS